MCAYVFKMNDFILNLTCELKICQAARDKQGVKYSMASIWPLIYISEVRPIEILTYLTDINKSLICITKSIFGITALHCWYAYPFSRWLNNLNNEIIFM